MRVNLTFVGRKNGALGWGDNFELLAEIPEGIPTLEAFTDYVLIRIIYVDHEHVYQTGIRINGKSVNDFFNTDYRE